MGRGVGCRHSNTWTSTGLFRTGKKTDTFPFLAGARTMAVMNLRPWELPPRDLQPRTEKRCTHCRELKPFGEFPTDKATKDGLSSWCRSCHAEANRRWRAKRRVLYDEQHTD
jgi:hypothetical protein